MPKRFTIHLERAGTAIHEPLTKFGGQPTWITQPTWPMSPTLGIPMVFVCQVVLPGEVVGSDLAGKIAFFFMTDGSDVNGQYLSGGLRDDGEAIVIVQPDMAIPECATTNMPIGPAIHFFDPLGPCDSRGRLTRCVYPEYRVSLEAGDDPDYVPDGILWGWDNEDPTRGGWAETERNAYYSAIEGDKIGGTPYFLQSEEFPPDDDWILLLQFGQLPDPCLNLGDAGMGYVFLSRDGQRSQFIVQSC